MTLYLNVFFAFSIGCVSAFAELLSRYKKVRPILTKVASLLYLLINGVSSVLAYYFIVEFGLVKNEIWRVILAGTSSLIILRSSFANIKVGDKNIEAGIGAIMQVFLTYADRSFDQVRSQDEIKKIKEIMKNVDFERAKLALPTICFSIMKNVGPQELDKISADVKALTDSNLDNLTKAISLGILLAAVTDTALLAQAVLALEESIAINGTASTPIDQLNQIISDIQDRNV